MKDQKFYIHDQVKNTILYDLSLETTKKIIQDLHQFKEVSFNIYAHNPAYPRNNYNLVSLQPQDQITSKFTWKGFPNWEEITYTP